MELVEIITGPSHRVFIAGHSHNFLHPGRRRRPVWEQRLSCSRTDAIGGNVQIRFNTCARTQADRGHTVTCIKFQIIQLGFEDRCAVGRQGADQCCNQVGAAQSPGSRRHGLFMLDLAFAVAVIEMMQRHSTEGTGQMHTKFSQAIRAFGH